jgi:hypothetical protein
MPAYPTPTPLYSGNYELMSLNMSAGSLATSGHFQSSGIDGGISVAKWVILQPMVSLNAKYFFPLAERPRSYTVGTRN